MLILFGVFLGGLVTFHLLETVAPIRTDYKAGVTRRGYLADVTATLVNGPVLSAVTKIVGYWLVTRIPAQLAVMPDWSWAVQFAVFFLVNDFLRYWLHRWYHASGALWRIHRVHHTIVEMDALSVFRLHVLEAVIKNCLIFLPFQLAGVSESVILVYSSIDILKGFWHHANFRTHVGPVSYFLNTAELHWWHHSTESRGQHSNYGSILSIWDRLFGTFLFLPGQWPAEIGVEGMEAFPDTYLGQLASIRHDDEAAKACFPPTEATEPTAQPQAGARPSTA